MKIRAKAQRIRRYVKEVNNIQWQSKEVNTVLGKIIMRDYSSVVTLLYH